MAVKPLIIILCLQSESAFAECNPDILPALAQKSVVRKAKTLSQARRYLNSTTRPHVVIVSDAAVTYPENHELLPRLVEYAKAGGTVLYSGIFSSMVLYPDLKAMFKTVWGLPWRVCAYTSGNFTVNPRVKGIATKSIIEKCYVKSTRIDHVALEDAIYVNPSAAKKLKNLPEGQSSSEKTYETFAAVAKVGRGRVAYMGDFNPEPITVSIVMGLCFWPGARPLIAPGDGVPEVIHTGLAIVEDDLPPRADPPKRNILIISLERSEYMDDIYPQFYQALRKTAALTEVQQPRAAQAALTGATPRPDAVILSDCTLASPKNSKLLTRLVAYARGGGTVVAALQFGNSAKTGALRSFFAAWGVPWDRGSYHRTTTALNPSGIPAPLSKDALLPTVSALAVHLSRVPNAHAVYLPTADSRVESRSHAPERLTREQEQQSPAALAPVGQGHFGYVGDVNGEQGSTRLVFEMCGVKIRPGDLGPRVYQAGVCINPDGTPEPIIETEEEVPLPAPAAPAPPPREPRPRDAEVAERAEARAKVREDKIRRADVLKEEGNALFGQQKWGEAAEKYRAAALLAGPHPVYVSNLAASLLKMELWEVAESAATRALVHDPRHVKSLYRRALARKGLEQFKDALTDLEWLLSIDRMNATALTEKVGIRETVLARDKNANWLDDPSVRARRDEYLATEVDDESDSEDFAHPGTGLACKDYNTSDSGCRNGATCRSNHGPDLKSVRDDLGRNVCVYWLLGHCRFDAAGKCIYAHSATYLPERGWWTDTARLERIRAEFDAVVKEEPLDLGAGRVEERILAEAFVPLRWREELWAIATYSVQFRDRGFGFYQDDEYLRE
ncbi:transporter [Ganoderma sinense ZZ0214-1]|uniref:Transporter n=1 Tax=Ganoderma sinense ZZ0214-1 TaxID=1077348 RepID=A0A2G8SFG6_9APHY|nr:transporter [Ganoderma sinense ZZ0214-1]